MSNDFERTSNALADVIQAAGASIVRVDARRRLPATGIVWSAEGLVVSANHVVERDDDISIGLPDGQNVSATVVGRDPATDLVVLRAEASNLAAADWASGTTVRVGSLALAAGRPYRDVEVSIGALSAVGGAWRTQAGGRIDRYLRPEITMYPGFSGGPLVLASGQFAGLNTSGLLHHADATIPAETVRRTVETIATHGRIPHGYLGVGVQPVQIASAQAGVAGADTGLMVMSVEDNSPAEAAGVHQGDILVALGELGTGSISDLRVALSNIDAAKEVTLRVIRSNELLELTANVELR